MKAISKSTVPRKLHQREQQIERAREAIGQNWLRIGWELCGIHDAELYRGRGYTRWNDYLEDRWGFERSYAHRVMQAARDAAVLSIDNVAQSRALAPLGEDVDAKRSVIATVQAMHGKMTAAFLEAEVAKRLRELNGPVPGPLPSAWATPIESVHHSELRFRYGSLSKLKASLRRWGQMKPILVERDAPVIVTGNRIYDAAKELGWSHVAAIPIEITDEDELMVFRLADNEIGDSAAAPADLSKVRTALDAIEERFGAVVLRSLMKERL